MSDFKIKVELDMGDYFEGTIEGYCEHLINEELSNQVTKLYKKNKKLKECLEFVVRQSGTSTDYNKRARECLEELE